MRLVTFRLNAEPATAARTGVLVGEHVIDMKGVANVPHDMRHLLAGGVHTLDLVKQAVAAASTKHALADVKLHAPISNPDKIVCTGLNYRDHAVETGAAIPPEPVLFNKFNSAIVGPGEPVLIPSIVKEPDYEVELVIVIGSRTKNVPEAEALDHVVGYTVGHDVSARDWQLKKAGGQWMVGKAFDTFGPIGPAIVTKDEVGDVHNLAIKCHVSGETMQNSTTAQLIFNIPQVVSYCSKVFTLLPGDLIFTGTPPGVGFARKPPRYLKHGDVVVCEVEKIGKLENPIIFTA